MTQFHLLDAYSKQFVSVIYHCGLSCFFPFWIRSASHPRHKQKANKKQSKAFFCWFLLALQFSFSYCKEAERSVDKNNCALYVQSCYVSLSLTRTYWAPPLSIKLTVMCNKNVFIVHCQLNEKEGCCAWRRSQISHEMCHEKPWLSWSYFATSK